MSETTVAAAGAEYNPFEPEHQSKGGGLWDGKTVTITSAQARTEALKNGDGSPVIDEKTKQQVIQTALYIKGIAEGGDDKERHEEYSAGDKMVAAPDGEGFVMKDGTPPKFHASSNIGKFTAALKGSGFDLSTLFANGKQKLSGLVGARFVFKAEAKIGKDGKPIKDKKGYVKNIHLPIKYVGAAIGITAPKPGNGAVAPSNDALAVKAQGAVLAVLANGPLSRAELIRSLAIKLAGDADSNSVIGLVVRDDFHKGQPWVYDGLSAHL